MSPSIVCCTAIGKLNLAFLASPTVTGQPGNTNACNRADHPVR